MSANWKISPPDRLLLRRNLLSFVTKSPLVLVLCAVAAVSDLAKAEGANRSILYQLNADSSLMQGCFPPCLCPLQFGVPVKATFLLTPAGSDSLFTTYAVTNVSWIFSINGTNLFVTGGGTYKVGGEVALQQELSLDLHLGGSSVKHFDSGLVADSAPFPNIKVSISANGQVCFDQVFNVSASPVSVPQLRVALAGTNMIVLSWPVSVSPFVLQQSSDLITSNWTIVTNVPNIVGQQNQVILSPSPGNQFYRLQPSGN